MRGRREMNNLPKYAGGFLEVGTTGAGEVIVNHPDLKPDENGVGHIVFSIDEARNLARLLNEKASDAYDEVRDLKEKEWRAQQEATVPPVDRSARVLADGSPETDDHREINPSTGQQKGYIVLSAEERAKGFIRPVRRTYRHKTCNTITTCSLSIAETYARDPFFYSGTFCCTCLKHFPLTEFIWEGSDEQVGT